MGYLGSKGASGAYQKIIARMPVHDTYIESFLGMGAVIRNKPPALKNIAIDIDPQTITDFERLTWPGADRVELINTDAFAYLRDFDYSTAGRVLIYCDPPYLLSTRTSSAKYRFEFTVEDHINLLTLLKQLPASVILSGYPSELYNHLLPGWRTTQFQVMSRGGARTEKLWLNFAAGAAYSPAFAGVNFTDRQRIKRKAERWAKNYEGLPPAERLAVMSELLKVDDKEKPEY